MLCITNFKAFKWLHKVLKELFMQSLRTRFSGILCLYFNTCHIWWTAMDSQSLSFFFSFPGIPVALVHDITSPNSFCLQLNENTHCVLMIYRACQVKNWSYTCRGHFSLFFSGPLSDALQLTSDKSTPQTQAQPSSMAIHVHHLARLYGKQNASQYPVDSPGTYCKK